MMPMISSCQIINVEEGSLQQSEPVIQNNMAEQGSVMQIDTFEYTVDPHAPVMPVSELWSMLGAEETDASEAAQEQTVSSELEDGVSGDFEQLLAEENRKSFEAGREQGRQTEREALVAAQAEAEKQRRQQIAKLVERFTQEQEHYLHKVEPEVVKLALAVAARILRREAQMDPLLLTGAVRVALGQLSESTQVRLLVPPAELSLWTEAMSLVPNLAAKPTVAAGEGMLLGDCKIETEMGSVDIGIRAQLNEIERGFFDRAGGSTAGLAREPRNESGNGSSEVAKLAEVATSRTQEVL
jgi:flagellar assembly protein FliH